ncbi:MAG: SHOCT domain-containing protein [Pseudonocardia sp.]|nr:SHOCT domain-containing protein [Pseudonocardia sp.]
MRRGIGRARRGPSLLGTAARTAVIAGTASSVAGRVTAGQQAAAHRDQQGRDAQAQLDEIQRQQQVDAQVAAALAQQQQPAAAPAAGTDDVIARLTQLGELRAAGVLTEDEFAAQKARILGS